MPTRQTWQCGRGLAMAGLITAGTAVGACMPQSLPNGPEPEGSETACPMGECPMTTASSTSGGPGSGAADEGGWTTDADLLCTPGERSCQRGTIVQCAADGQTQVEVHACGDGAYCNPSTATCDTATCQANTPACDGQIATLCNSIGDGFVPGGSDCAAIDRHCKDGQCLQLHCQPGWVGCIDGDVQRCADDGWSTDVVEECSDDELCIDGESQCTHRVCEPLKPACDGPRATLCNAEGTGFDPGGMDCAALGRNCFEGICTDQLCLPDAWLCVDGDLHRCSEDGRSSELEENCGSDEFCSIDPPGCTDHRCEPGEPVCDELRATTCKDDGSGFEPGGRNCGAEQLGCAEGTCVHLGFEANFDNGDLDAWEPVADHSFRAISEAAAQGTNRGLRLTGDGMLTAYAGIFHHFTHAFQPSRVSYWVRLRQPPQDSGTAVFSLQAHHPPKHPPVMGVHFDSNAGILAYNGVEPVELAKADVGEWMHVEIKNIDWQRATCDYLVDGIIVGEGFEFHDPDASSVVRLDLYHYKEGDADFDEIVVE